MANIYITIPGDQWDVIAKKVYLYQFMNFLFI